MPEDAIRILIADDHAVVRTGLRALLDRAQGMLTVGEATDSEQALQKANELRPDVVLLDISMPGPGGIEVTKQLKDMLPQTHVLILTVHKDERLLQEAIRAGASGYVTKNALEPELINAIHAVHRGDLSDQAAVEVGGDPGGRDRDGRDEDIRAGTLRDGDAFTQPHEDIAVPRHHHAIAAMVK